MHQVFLTECPRDAMQGLHEFIPTATKVRYLNALLKVGFPVLDFGSFVSPKAIPQLRDTAEVLDGLDLSSETMQRTKLLAIIANARGAADAVKFEPITFLGFPLSVSETFQQRNTNKSIAEALAEVAQIQDLCLQHNKKMVVYLSMGFGNPYGEPYEVAQVEQLSEKLVNMGIETIALSDTIGVSNPSNIKPLFQALNAKFPNVTFSAHLHSNPATAIEKVAAAYEAGCRHFDAAIRGFGGCPMAKDDLTGNVATEQLLQFFKSQNIATNLNEQAFAEAFELSAEVFAQ
jgi:hydroxymethylglutaryl-CoA lyase